jgi:hypothetical protein
MPKMLRKTKYFRTAQHAHPADRFARKIAAILDCDTMRSRRLMRNPLARLTLQLPQISEASRKTCNLLGSSRVYIELSTITSTCRKAGKMKQQRPFHETWTSLINVLQAANNIVPGIVVIGMLLAAIVILVSLLSTTLMVGVTVLLVGIVSIVIYAKTSNYGEAALALVAGLLTVFTVEWTAGRFIAFTVAWIGFTLIALMISSVRLAAKLESIYTHAAASLSNDPSTIRQITKRLQDIGRKRTQYGQLQAVERAEAIRLLVFRKIPIDSLADAVSSVEIFSTFTRVDPRTITLFIADISKILQLQTPDRYQQALSRVLSIIRESAVQPEDFIKAFQQSRRLVLSGAINTEAYFQAVRENLETGVAPEDMLGAIQEAHNFLPISAQPSTKGLTDTRSAG